MAFSRFLKYLLFGALFVGCGVCQEDLRSNSQINQATFAGKRVYTIGASYKIVPRSSKQFARSRRALEVTIDLPQQLDEVRQASAGLVR